MNFKAKSALGRHSVGTSDQETTREISIKSYGNSNQVHNWIRKPVFTLLVSNVTVCDVTIHMYIQAEEKDLMITFINKAK